MAATTSEIGETVSNIFSYTLALPLTAVEASGHAVDIAGCVHITGKENLILLIEADKTFLSRAASAFLETSSRVPNSDLPEVFGEIVNVIAGNLTGMFGDAHFTLPTVSMGPLLVPNVVATSRDSFREESGGVLTLVFYPGVPFAELAAG